MQKEKRPPGVYKHHGSWWIVYYITGPDGRRVRHREHTDCTSARKAGKLRAARMTEHDRGERTVETGKVTVGDAMKAVLEEYELKGRRSLRTARGFAKAIEATLGKHTLAVNVADKIDAAQLTWQKAKLTNATINRRGNLLRHGLRLLVRKRQLAYVPFIQRLPEQSEPGRYITAKDADAIRKHLPEYAAAVFSLALLLGIRKGQLTRTLRPYVDLERGVIDYPPSECKHLGRHTVPLDSDALAIVEAATADARTHCTYLFHGPDCAPGRKPSKGYGCVGEFKKAWGTALKDAGLAAGRKRSGYTFHHTRVTAATDMRAGGLGEDDVMRVGGWKTREVFGRYNLGDVEALRERLAATRSRRGKVVPLRKAQGE
jgi:integrase